MGSFLSLDFDGDAAVHYPKLLQLLLQDIGTPLKMRNLVPMFQSFNRTLCQLTEYTIKPVETWHTEVSSDSVQIQ